MACRTQWIWVAGGMGKAFRTGLDYSRVLATMTLLDLAADPAPLFRRLQIAEVAALNAMAEKVEK